MLDNRALGVLMGRWHPDRFATDPLALVVGPGGSLNTLALSADRGDSATGHLHQSLRNRLLLKVLVQAPVGIPRGQPMIERASPLGIHVSGDLCERLSSL